MHRRFVAILSFPLTSGGGSWENEAIRDGQSLSLSLFLSVALCFLWMRLRSAGVASNFQNQCAPTKIPKLSGAISDVRRCVESHGTRRRVHVRNPYVVQIKDDQPRHRETRFVPSLSLSLSLSLFAVSRAGKITVHTERGCVASNVNIVVAECVASLSRIYFVRARCTISRDLRTTKRTCEIRKKKKKNERREIETPSLDNWRVEKSINLSHFSPKTIRDARESMRQI